MLLCSAPSCVVLSLPCSDSVVPSAHCLRQTTLYSVLGSGVQILGRDNYKRRPINHTGPMGRVQWPLHTVLQCVLLHYVMLLVVQPDSGKTVTGSFVNTQFVGHMAVCAVLAPGTFTCWSSAVGVHTANKITACTDSVTACMQCNCHIRIIWGQTAGSTIRLVWAAGAAQVLCNCKRQGGRH